MTSTDAEVVGEYCTHIFRVIPASLRNSQYDQRYEASRRISIPFRREGEFFSSVPREVNPVGCVHMRAPFVVGGQAGKKSSFHISGKDYSPFVNCTTVPGKGGRLRRKEAERGFGFGVASFVRTGKWDMGINPATAGLIFGARDVIVRRQGQPGARRDPDARSASQLGTRIFTKACACVVDWHVSVPSTVDAG